MKFIMQNCRNHIQNYSGTFGKHWVKFKFGNHLWMVSLLGQCLTWSSNSSSVTMCVERNGHTHILDTRYGFCEAHFLKCLCSLSG